MTDPDLPGSHKIRFRLGAPAPPFWLMSTAVGILPDPLYLHVPLYCAPRVPHRAVRIMLAGGTTVFRADRARVTLGAEVLMLRFFPGQISRGSPLQDHAHESDAGKAARYLHRNRAP
jgi:hypothetical protein